MSSCRGEEKGEEVVSKICLLLHTHMPPVYVHIQQVVVIHSRKKAIMVDAQEREGEGREREKGREDKGSGQYNN